MYNFTILDLGDWFIIWKDPYSAMVLFPTYKPQGTHSNFLLSIESLEFCGVFSLFFLNCFHYTLNTNLVSQLTLHGEDSVTLSVTPLVDQS